ERNDTKVHKHHTDFALLPFFPTAGLSKHNGKVYFVSRNFDNILHWKPLEPSYPGEKVLYSVQYWSIAVYSHLYCTFYSDAKEQSYQIKEECQNITALSCNLTAETPSVHDVHYKALVFANGSIHGRTNSFKPLADTILSPPTLFTHTTVSSLYVNVTLPLGPNRVSVADIFINSKNGPSKAVTVYTLHITHPKWAAQVNKNTTGGFVFNLKNNQTEYCGYVVYVPFTEWGRSESEKAFFCVTLKSDPLMLLPWVLASAVLLVAIAIASVVCLRNYVKGGKKRSTPESLWPTLSIMPGLLHFSVLNISKLEVCPKNDQTVYAAIQVKPNEPSVRAEGYSPQDIPCLGWQDSTGSSVGTGATNSEATSAQSSENYSAVVVHVPLEENPDIQQATTEDRETSNPQMPSSREGWDKGGMSPNLTSKRVQPVIHPDAYESSATRPLIVPTVRGLDGQLILPSFSSEKKLHLSDLIDSKREGPSLASLQSFDGSEWSDSGCDESIVNTPTQPYCNTHYFPSQPAIPDFTPSSDAVLDSGYKQNWLPAILHGTKSKDSCEYRRTNYPWNWTAPAPKEEEEVEEEEEGAQEEKSRQILLGEHDTDALYMFCVVDRGASCGVTMETRIVMQREQEEQSSQMSHSMQLSSQIKKKTFTSSDEEASYSDFYPIIPADLMSVKEILDMDNLPRHRTWEILMETMAADEEYHRDKWTLFGNEVEKVEVDVIRNQQILRKHVDRLALRKQAEKKASAHIKYLELLSQKAPDFPIPLRAHTVWEGMTVKLSCTVQGCPPPKVTWCSPDDAGEYKVIAKSPLGEAMTFGTLVVNFEVNFGPEPSFVPSQFHNIFSCFCLHLRPSLPLANLSCSAALPLCDSAYQGAVAGSEHSQTSGKLTAFTYDLACKSTFEIKMIVLDDGSLKLEQEAQFGDTFPPTWVKEGKSLTLQCTFTSALLAFQQDVCWFRDGVQLHQSSTVDIETVDNKASITLKAAHKEHEGVYTVRLRTWEDIQEHSAFVYVKDASAAVLGGPASPLAVQVSDVNKDYVFLTWQPPSADGASPVEGYYVERCEIGQGEWVRCNVHIQKMCHYPVFGLKEGTLYQFRVRAVNRAGAGRPSKATEPVLTTDPLEHTRTMVVKVDRGRTITITKDELEEIHERLEGQVKAPFPPTNVHTCEVSDTYVVLSWDEPEPRGREPLTFYVERSLAGKSSWDLASLDMVVNAPRFPVFDLVKGKQYCFRVRSINKYGVSDPSEPSALVSLGKPQAVPAPPHSVMAIRDSDTSVLLQWQEPKEKDDILGYYLYYSETGKQDWMTVNNKPVKKNRFTVHGLKTRGEYVFRVKSVSRAGNSEYSEQSRPIVVKSAIHVPSAPSAIALLLCTGSEMVLGWRAPACNGGDPVRGYYLDQREKGMETWREVNVKPAKEKQFKVCNLTSEHFYQFRVFAANLAGVGKPSEASEAFLCEKWTMPEPGCPYDVEVREVRDSSLELLWVAPLYEGRGPVTGYLLEISQDDQSDNWTILNEQPVSDTHYKVSGLQTGQTYRLRVSAVNEAGVGSASLPTEPVTAQTRPGTKNIEIGVDDDGFIFLGYRANEMNDESEFLWSKNYIEPIDAGRAQAETKKDRSVLTFTDPSEEDLGLYTVEMSDNPNLSSSYDFTAEVIALKSGWQVEVSEKGDVRLWLQTESLSNAAELRLIFNDREISSTPHRKINFDKAKGLVEILFDRLSREDEGSYTAQLRDGRAKNQFTLVFVDQKFRQTLALADAKRRDHERKSGPYFQEFLTWSVNEDCELIMKCKVTNTNKDTSLKWLKEGVEVTQVVYDKSSGVSTLTISQVTKKEAGSYKVVVSDRRGEDVSGLELLDDGESSSAFSLSISAALSASQLKIESTAEGFKIYSSLKYYISYLKTSWYFKEKRIDQEARTKPGSSMQKVWIEILNPTENDKGKYTLEMFDGKETHKRQLDLSGQVFADALLEYQRLKQAAIAEKSESKLLSVISVHNKDSTSLCLTCFIEGEPAPEIFWLRNDREIVNQAQFTITKEPKCSTITVNNVKTEDSGKYSIFVRNKYGSETVDVTVSVYKHGEKPPANAVEMC
ncbi:hypothetical protein L3Q82_013438, partial [Scortum barcoo]